MGSECGQGAAIGVRLEPCCLVRVRASPPSWEHEDNCLTFPGVPRDGVNSPEVHCAEGESVQASDRLTAVVWTRFCPVSPTQHSNNQPYWIAHPIQNNEKLEAR